MKHLFPVCLTSLLLSLKRIADLLNALNSFWRVLLGINRVAAGNFCYALRADLQKGEEQNYFPRGKLKPTREKNNGTFQVYGFRNILLMVVSSVENSL